MRRLVLIALMALPLFGGFFPSTTHTKITAIEGEILSLKSALPVTGMSGIVVHNYGNGTQSATSFIEQTAKGHAKVIDKDIIHHDALPTIKTAIAKGDKVIGGYLYNTVLLLAPDAQTYARITSAYHKKWIHPDHFALFLNKLGERQPTKANLLAFAKSYQIGLIAIVKQGSLTLLDPISQKTIATKPLKNLPSEGKSPFFMRFDSLRSGWFSTSKTLPYYQMMEAI